MAEAFGIAVGAIGLAPAVVELGEAIKKLKDFCRDAKTAPEDIQAFADEVHAIAALLDQLEACSLMDAPAELPAISTCVSQCTRACKQVSAIATELQSGLKSHRTLTRLTYPLRNERIKRLTDKLERAKSSLLLAATVYSIWLSATNLQQQQQTSLVMRSMVNNSASASSPRMLVKTAHAASASNSYVSRASTNSTTRASTAFVEEVVWNCLADALSSLREIYVMSVTRGWKYCFRSYKIVPWSHPAFDLCRKGDMMGLRRMLCAREVSLHDQTDRGETLFADSRLTCYWTFICVCGLQQLYQVENLREGLQFLVDDCGLEPDLASTELEINTFLKTPSLWTSDDLFNLLDVARVNGSFGLSTLLTLLRMCTRLTYTRSTPRIWAEILSLSARGHCDLHALDPGMYNNTGTPLHTFLYRALLRRAVSCTNLDNLTAALRSLVVALAAAGVDLVHYGRRETALWLLISTEDNLYRPRIIGFEYGPDVSDWKIMTEQPGDQYAGIFWTLIEDPPREVPGSWYEPDGGLWEDRYFKRKQAWLEERRNDNKCDDKCTSEGTTSK